MANLTKTGLEQLTTEARNPMSKELDNLSAHRIVQLINSEDAKIASAVGAVSEVIAAAIDIIAERLAQGGRLIYLGAGTSGRLGVLDAVECPPTFNTEPELVQGLIAGGYEGLVRAVEGAEDSRDSGAEDLQRLALNDLDVVVGITASGRTPYVIGALDYARKLGAFAIGLCCNQDAELAQYADLNINPVVGAEVVSGSTRLKAGTATKMVLNMLSTGAMVRMGKTYSNLMVDLQATNSKLSERAVGIVATLTGCNRSEAGKLLTLCDGKVKVAIVAHALDISPAAASIRLTSVHGHLRQALESNLPDTRKDK